MGSEPPHRGRVPPITLSQPPLPLTLVCRMYWTAPGTGSVTTAATSSCDSAAEPTGSPRMNLWHGECSVPVSPQPPSPPPVRTEIPLLVPVGGGGEAAPHHLHELGHGVGQREDDGVGAGVEGVGDLRRHWGDMGTWGRATVP